jgi:hypothetical protein
MPKCFGFTEVLSDMETVTDQRKLENFYFLCSLFPIGSSFSCNLDHNTVSELFHVEDKLPID